MGFRVRKSIGIAPGVRLNVTKTGIGATAGDRGARYGTCAALDARNHAHRDCSPPPARAHAASRRCRLQPCRQPLPTKARLYGQLSQLLILGR